MLIVETKRVGYIADSIWGPSITPIVFCGICWYAFEKKELVDDAPKRWENFSFIGAFILFFWLCWEGFRIVKWQIQRKIIKAFFLFFIVHILTFINGCIFGVRAFMEGRDIIQNYIKK